MSNVALLVGRNAGSVILLLLRIALSISLVVVDGSFNFSAISPLELSVNCLDNSLIKSLEKLSVTSFDVTFVLSSALPYILLMTVLSCRISSREKSLNARIILSDSAFSIVLSCPSSLALNVSYAL